MNNFVTIFKTLFTRNFSTTSNKKKKKYSKYAVLSIILLISIVSVAYNFILYDALRDTPLLIYYPVLFISFTILIVIINSIFRVNSTLFSDKDHNILVPMPVRKTEMLSAKLMVFYMEQLLYSAILLAPTVVLYGIEENMFFLYGTVAIFVLPLICVLLSFVLGLIISILINRFPVAKMIGTILYIALFIAFVGAMYYNMYSGDNESTGSGFGSLGSAIADIPPFTYIVDAFVNFKHLEFFIILAISIVSMALVIVIYSFLYDSLYDTVTKHGKKKEYKTKSLKSSGFMKSILKNDALAFLHSPTLLLQTIVGGIMSVILAVTLSIMYVSGEELTNEMKDLYSLLMPLLICMTGTMTSTTSFAISLEKKTFWLIKSMPIDKSKYLNAKLIFNHIINGTLVFIASLATIIIIRFNVWQSIFIIVFGQVYVLAFGVFGLILNLKLPKLNWDNFNQIKNSASVFIQMFGEIALSLIFLASAIAMAIFVNLILAYVVLGCLTAAFFICMIIIYKNVYEKWFDRIDC